MYCAIDMDLMQVLQVHRVQDILHGLVYLENANSEHVRFDNTDSHLFLAPVSTVGMQILFRNVTGEDEAVLTHLQRRAAIAVAIESMRPPLVDDQELDKQISYAGNQLHGPVGKVPLFRYTLGARVPKIGEEWVFSTIKRDDKQRSATQGAATRLQTLPAATTPATAGPTLARQKTGVARVAGAEPTGGVAGQVWIVADKMWKAAGSQKDVKAVLTLRMTMMKVLEEEHDIKRTTSSNTLGQWMKARLS